MIRSEIRIESNLRTRSQNMHTRVSAILASALICAAAAAQTVTVTLSSSADGGVVAPGAIVSWSIDFTTSSGDNEGLALLVADLVQDELNPELFDIPHAAGVPAGMSNFARPAGITNPGDGAIAGYRGVQRGTAGEMNLLQIGGAQNNFGTATPGGTGVAENANLVPAVGQGGATLLASGSFTAPDTCGDYIFRLENVLANTLADINAPPAHSPTTAATVTLAGGSIAFTVGVLGDIDGSGTVDLADLAVLLSQFGQSGDLSGDLNGDNVVDLTDLALMLANFGTGC